jgi:hypothetical protein
MKMSEEERKILNSDTDELTIADLFSVHVQRCEFHIWKRNSDKSKYEDKLLPKVYLIYLILIYKDQIRSCLYALHRK